MWEVSAEFTPSWKENLGQTEREMLLGTPAVDTSSVCVCI